MELLKAAVLSTLKMTPMVASRFFPACVLDWQSLVKGAVFVSNNMILKRVTALTNVFIVAPICEIAVLSCALHVQLEPRPHFVGLRRELQRRHLTPLTSKLTKLS